MAKRFTETSKWDKPWFRKLSVKMKAVWFFLVERCDSAGIWEIDYDAFEYFVGEPVTKEEILEAFGDHVQFLDDGKLFLSKFIEFQYGTLSPDCKPHKPVIERLKKLGLWENLKGYSKGFQTLEEKDKEKEKEKEKENRLSDSQRQELQFNAEFQEFKQVCEDEGLLSSPKFKIQLAEVFTAFGSLENIRKVAKGVKASKGYKALDSPESRAQYLRAALLREAGLIEANSQGGAA